MLVTVLVFQSVSVHDVSKMPNIGCMEWRAHGDAKACWKYWVFRCRRKVSGQLQGLSKCLLELIPADLLDTLVLHNTITYLLTAGLSVCLCRHRSVGSEALFQSQQRQRSWELDWTITGRFTNYCNYNLLMAVTTLIANCVVIGCQSRWNTEGFMTWLWIKDWDHDLFQLDFAHGTHSYECCVLIL